MSYTLTWAGTTLPDAKTDGIEVEEMVIGSTHRTADATLRQSVVELKHVVRIDWPLLSSADWTTLHGAWVANAETAAVLVLPSGDSYTVVGRSLRRGQRNMGGSTIRYQPTIVFEEE